MMKRALILHPQDLWQDGTHHTAHTSATLPATQSIIQDARMCITQAIQQLPAAHNEAKPQPLWVLYLLPDDGTRTADDWFTAHQTVAQAAHSLQQEIAQHRWEIARYGSALSHTATTPRLETLLWRASVESIPVLALAFSPCPVLQKRWKEYQGFLALPYARLQQISAA